MNKTTKQAVCKEWILAYTKFRKKAEKQHAPSFRFLKGEGYELFDQQHFSHDGIRTGS